MPLLHKKPFTKKKPSSNLKPTDKVFFCELTEEVFTDYDEFWERLVLLNALVWTCELTGRPNLTYQEALESEKKARKCISNVSSALKKPLLYVSTLTKRGRIVDASDDIFNFVRDRYFVGEEVEAIVSNHWYDCKLTKVIMPTKEEIEKYQKSLEDSDSEVTCLDSNLVNGKHADDDDDDIMIIHDDHLSKSVKDSDVQVVKDEDEDYPPFPTVKYEVIEIEAWDLNEPKRHIVGWDQIRRSKSAFTREKCKLFVKQYLVLGHEGYWKVKDSIKKTFKINELKFTDIFVGTPPKFEETLLKKIPVTAKIGSGFKKDKDKGKDKDTVKEKERTKDKEKEREKKNKAPKQKEVKEKKEEPQKDKEADLKKKKKPVMTEEMREAAKKFQLELKEKSKELFRKRLEQQKLETKFKREVQKEENRLMKIYEIEWWQKREDLECEDNKDMPSTNTFTSRIPTEYFGDFLMVLDFVNAFAEILELTDVYPDGISYEVLEQAVVSKEVAGVFNDVIQLFLGAIFSLQEEEDEEVDGDTTVDMASMNFEENLESKCQKAAVNFANKASTWSQQYQGVSLQKAPLDALTLTEILRIHILASGATNVANAAWRHLHRGGFKHTDDPGLQFKLDEPEIIKKLNTIPLFDMTIEEKIKIMNVLVAQILTYASVRDNIEEKLDKLKELSNNYRSYKYAAVRKEKEEVNARKLKVKEIKEKMEKKLLDIIQTAGNDTQEEITKARICMEERIEEVEADKDKETRAAMKKREELEKQEKDFIEQIESLNRDMRQFQLGQDRAFRRYWIFNSIPGLFVEDTNDNLGTCLDYPTPIGKVVYPKDNKELKEVIKSVAIRNVQIRNKERDNEKNTSDKENDNSFQTPIKNEVKTPLLEKNLLKAPNNNVMHHNSSVNGKASEEEQYSPTSNEEEDEIIDFVSLPDKPYKSPDNFEELHSRIFGLCSANSLTCPVHTNQSRPRWSYYNKEEDLENLINSLNERGVRECELRDNLILHKEKIKMSIQVAAGFNFIPIPKEEDTNELKKCLKRNLNFPPDTPIDRIMELTLRDIILETEEKIDNGMLGVLKVPKRESWKQAIVDGTSLTCINMQDLDWGGKKRINQFKSSLGMEITEDDTGDLDDFVSKDGLTQVGIVKELAVAILQVSQALDHKYLQPPLAEASKFHKKRRSLEERLTNKFKNKKAEAEGNNDESSEEEEEVQESKTSSKIPKNIDNALRTPFERWEKSLMACTSFSQLCLHLATFDNSISWSRSAVTNKRCRVCKRRSDADNVMLLCDGCDGGFHLYCLKPKLKCVPPGDWFCPKCKPKIKPKSPRKQRSVLKEDSDEGEDEKEEQEEEEDDEEEEEDRDFVNLEYCYACENGGELVLCDTCPKSFHLACAELRKIPKGSWSCHFCRGESKENSSNKRKSNSGKSTPKSNKKLKTDEEIEEALMRRSSRSRAELNVVLNRLQNGKRSLDAEVAINKEAIEKVIHQLMSNLDSKPFRKPVYRQDAPDYYEKIKKPIDLRTIKQRFNKDKYVTDAEFIADVLLIFQNTQQYFKETSEEYNAGLKLSKFFLNKVRNSNLRSAGLIDNEPPSKRKRKS